MTAVVRAEEYSAYKHRCHSQRKYYYGVRNRYGKFLSEQHCERKFKQNYYADNERAFEQRCALVVRGLPCTACGKGFVRSAYFKTVRSRLAVGVKIIVSRLRRGNGLCLNGLRLRFCGLFLNALRLILRLLNQAGYF